MTTITSHAGELGFVNKNGSLYQVGRNGQEDLIIVDPDGRLKVKKEREFLNIKSVNYVPLESKSLSGVMELYQKSDPTAYAFILNNQENKSQWEAFQMQESAAAYSIEGGQVFEVVGGKKRQVLKTDSGWLVVKSDSSDGYRTVEPRVLSRLLSEYYAKDPKKFDSILTNKSNLRDVNAREVRNIDLVRDDLSVQSARLLEKRRAAPPPPTNGEEKKEPVSEQSDATPTVSIRGLDFQRKKFNPQTGNVLLSARHFNPITKKSERVYREGPSWAEKDTRTFFETEREAARSSEMKLIRGAPSQYIELIARYEKAKQIVDAAGRVPAPRFITDVENERLQEAADAIHLYWIKRVQEAGGADKLLPEEQERYFADLKIFEDALTTRYLKFYMEKGASEDSAGEDSVRDMVAFFKDDFTANKLTMDRLHELSELSGLVDASKKRYPRLKGLLLKIAGENMQRMNMRSISFEKFLGKVKETH